MKALISVYNKDNLDFLVKNLIDKGYEILATGGTYNYIKKMGYDVISVSDYTGSKEILNGRVKTLNPKIHGGILVRNDIKTDVLELEENNIDFIDIVVCNLYPFEEKLKENLVEDEMIEFIDIGGPTMLRSAAKNFKYKTVLVDPNDYELFIDNKIDIEVRKYLASKVFSITSKYDMLISNYLSNNSNFFDYVKAKELRYGENPHQVAQFFTNGKGFMSNFEQLNGKELGYINLLDINAAYQLALEFKDISCVAVKHSTPCGVASADTVKNAYIKARDCDDISIFGGVVAFNSKVDKACALEISKIMLHIIIAPEFDYEALEILKKKKNLILIKMNSKVTEDRIIKSVSGGLLIQDEDMIDYEQLKVVTELEPTKELIDEMKFAYKVVKHAKSNAIVVTKNNATVGIGSGSVSRILAANIALEGKYGVDVLASDAFFPFDDVVELASKHGVKAIIQPGGSIRDEDSIKKCNEKGIIMVFTNTRHFRH